MTVDMCLLHTVKSVVFLFCHFLICCWSVRIHIEETTVLLTMGVDIGLLITLVEGFPHLYDLRNKNFKDQRMKKNSWDEIAMAMNVPAEDCQRIWKNLRDRYTKAKRNLPTGTGSEDIQPEWEYCHAMQFLDKHIKPRKTITNTTCKETPASSASTASSSASSPWSSMDVLLTSPEPEPDIEEGTQREEIQRQVVGISQQETQQPQPVTPKHRKRQNDEDVTAVVGAVEKLTHHLINQTRTPPTQDTNDVFGIYVTTRLKEASDEEARILRAKITFLLENIKS